MRWSGAVPGAVCALVAAVALHPPSRPLSDHACQRHPFHADLFPFLATNRSLSLGAFFSLICSVVLAGLVFLHAAHNAHRIPDICFAGTPEASFTLSIRIGGLGPPVMFRVTAATSQPDIIKLVVQKFRGRLLRKPAQDPLLPVGTTVVYKSRPLPLGVSLGQLGIDELSAPLELFIPLLGGSKQSTKKEVIDLTADSGDYVPAQARKPTRQTTLKRLFAPPPNDDKELGRKVKKAKKAALVEQDASTYPRELARAIEESIGASEAHEKEKALAEQELARVIKESLSVAEADEKEKATDGRDFGQTRLKFELDGATVNKTRTSYNAAGSSSSRQAVGARLVAGPSRLCVDADTQAVAGPSRNPAYTPAAPVPSAALLASSSRRARRDDSAPRQGFANTADAPEDEPEPSYGSDEDIEMRHQYDDEYASVSHTEHDDDDDDQHGSEVDEDHASEVDDVVDEVSALDEASCDEVSLGNGAESERARRTDGPPSPNNPLPLDNRDVHSTYVVTDVATSFAPDLAFVRAGLANATGKLCWVNSGCQVLARIPGMVDLVFQHWEQRETCSDVHNSACVRCELAVIFLYLLRTSDTDHAATATLEAVERLALLLGMVTTEQQCASEFFAKVGQKLTEEDPRIPELFRLQVAATKSCQEGCTQPAQELVIPVTLSLPINGASTLSDALDAWVSQNWSCRGCGQRATLAYTWATVMLFHFGRALGNRDSVKGLKDPRPLAYPERFRPFRTGPVYRLFGVVTHHGLDMTDGHYKAHTRAPDGGWQTYNDARVYDLGSAPVNRTEAYVLAYVLDDAPQTEFRTARLQLLLAARGPSPGDLLGRGKPEPEQQQREHEHDPKHEDAAATEKADDEGLEYSADTLLDDLDYAVEEEEEAALEEEEEEDEKEEEEEVEEVDGAESADAVDERAAFAKQNFECPGLDPSMIIDLICSGIENAGLPLWLCSDVKTVFAGQGSRLSPEQEDDVQRQGYELTDSFLRGVRQDPMLGEERADQMLPHSGDWLSPCMFGHYPPALKGDQLENPPKDILEMRCHTVDVWLAGGLTAENHLIIDYNPKLTPIPRTGKREIRGMLYDREIVERKGGVNALEALHHRLEKRCLKIVLARVAAATATVVMGRPARLAVMKAIQAMRVHNVVRAKLLKLSVPVRGVKEAGIPDSVYDAQVIIAWDPDGEDKRTSVFIFCDHYCLSAMPQCLGLDLYPKTVWQDCCNSMLCDAAGSPRQTDRYIREKVARNLVARVARGIFPCRTCGQVFNWKNDRKAHERGHKAHDIREYHGFDGQAAQAADVPQAAVPRFDCGFACDASFFTLKERRRHERTAHPIFYCSYGECNAKFHDAQERLAHERGTHYWRKCHCGRTCSSEVLLERHKETHLGLKRYVCDFPECGKRFRQAVHLQSHAPTHTGKRPYPCDFPECGKRFTHAVTLRQHARTHTGERPYPCDFPECGKRFTQYGDLQKHERTHTGDKPYACEFLDCGQSFAQGNTLLHHERTHTGEKPYLCDSCGDRFRMGQHLQRHQLRHTGELPHVCVRGECTRSFARKDALRSHEKTCKGAVYVEKPKTHICGICGKAYVGRNELERHCRQKNH